jgi:hypothetical protein
MVAGIGAGTDDPSGFTFSSPAGGWFYIIAICDGDGQSATNAKFFTSSTSAELQKQNEGS